MPFDGNGNYVPPSNSWNPAVSATDIDPTDWNSTLDDLSTALSNCVTKDGQTAATAEVPFADGISTPLVQFPASQSPSADPNALDDYEEGTWSPTLLFGGLGAGITYAAGGREGTYTKIGNTVFARCYFQLTSKGSSTGIASLGGLPFANNATTGEFVVATVFPFSLGSITKPGATLAPSSQVMVLWDTNGSTHLQDTDFTNASEMVFSLFYRV